MKLLSVKTRYVRCPEHGQQCIPQWSACNRCPQCGAPSRFSGQGPALREDQDDVWKEMGYPSWDRIVLAFKSSLADISYPSEFSTLMDAVEVEMEPGTRQIFYVDYTRTLEVEVDESLLPDDKWRSIFYDVDTLAQVAAHIGWNVAKGFSSVEGFCGEEDKYSVSTVDETISEAVFVHTYRPKSADKDEE